MTDQREAWTPAEEERARVLQQQGVALYRALRACLRREPTPRERWRAQQAFLDGLEVTS